MKKKIKIIDLLCYIAIGDYDKLPKKVRYEEINWKLEINPCCGVDYSDETQYMFADYIDKHFCIQEILNDEVEILDEEDEFKDIEEMFSQGIKDEVANQNYNKYDLIDLFSSKINEVIKNQKKIIERLNNRDNN